MKAPCIERAPSTVGSPVVTAEPLAVLAARAAGALEHSIQRLVLARDHTLGHLEIQAAHDVQALLRQALERGAQAKADATPPVCPVCGRPLRRLAGGQARTFQSRSGAITVRRTRGYCQRGRKWRTPADAALGLEDSAGYSPAVQAMAALLTSKLPVADASAVLDHLSGVKLPRATLDRQAKRQGQRAQRLRTALDQQAATAPPQLELTLEPYQMILQLDAWNIRERDAWGKSAACRRRGAEPERWHWVYTGTCFRLDHRGQTAGALVIADGAVWIWRLADDRWPQARQRLDFYHAVPHLAAVGRTLFGEDKDRLKTWLKPLVQQLKHQSAVTVIRQLEDILSGLPAGPGAVAVQREVDYLRAHQARMDYRAAQRAGEPIGSGPVEATCRQAQCRFKRPGQFWSQAGDEALLCLETFWHNGRWSLLFPHTAFDPAKN